MSELVMQLIYHAEYGLSPRLNVSLERTFSGRFVVRSGSLAPLTLPQHPEVDEAAKLEDWAKDAFDQIYGWLRGWR